MEEDDNAYGFGPITKPRDAKKKNIVGAELCVIIVVTVLLLIYRVIVATPLNKVISYYDVYTFTGIISSLILCELIRRCCLFAEEYHHIDSRYAGSCIDAMKACLSLPEGKAEIGAIFVLFITINWWSSYDQTSVFPIFAFVIIKLAVSIAVQMCNIRLLSGSEMSDMIECDPKNVSEGLAWSFYLKYLKVVLPRLDNIFQQAAGENFQVDGGDICDKVTDKRLYVIIPKDCYCYKTFDEVDDRLKVVTTELPSFKEIRGFGGGERTYRHTLYEVLVEDMDSPKYVVMEYAAPLLALYDMSINAKVKFTEENRAQQVIQFYKKLQCILADDPECGGKCNLVLTGPGAIKIPPGQRKLADIICDEIRE